MFPLWLQEMWWGTLGTVRPFPDFSPDVDARDLQTALVKKGAFSQYCILILRGKLFLCE